MQIPNFKDAEKIMRRATEAAEDFRAGEPADRYTAAVLLIACAYEIGREDERKGGKTGER